MSEKVNIIYCVVCKDEIIFSSMSSSIVICLVKVLGGSSLDVVGDYEVLKIENHKQWKIVGTVKDIWNLIQEHEKD